MIRTLIVDDEPLRLRDAISLAPHGDVEVLGPIVLQLKH